MLVNYAGVITLFSGDPSQDEGPSIRVTASEHESIYYHAKELLDLNRWHHLAAIYDGAHIQCFIDGRLAECSLTTEGPVGLRPISAEPILKLSPIWPDIPFVIGGNTTNSSVRNRFPFSGRIRSVMVSNSVRYRETFVPEQALQPDPSTLAQYQLDPDFSQQLHDKSGNKIDAHAVGLFNTDEQILMEGQR